MKLQAVERIRTYQKQNELKSQDGILTDIRQNIRVLVTPEKDRNATQQAARHNRITSEWE